MKKLLAILFAVFALSAQARETITIIYAFGVGDAMANYDRALVDEANKLQDKYTFLFESPNTNKVFLSANFKLFIKSAYFLVFGASKLKSSRTVMLLSFAL